MNRRYLVIVSYTHQFVHFALLRVTVTGFKVARGGVTENRSDVVQLGKLFVGSQGHVT